MSTSAGWSVLGTLAHELEISALGTLQGFTVVLDERRSKRVRVAKHHDFSALHLWFGYRALLGCKCAAVG